MEKIRTTYCVCSMSLIIRGMQEKKKKEKGNILLPPPDKKIFKSMKKVKFRRNSGATKNFDNGWKVNLYRQSVKIIW